MYFGGMRKGDEQKAKEILERQILPEKVMKGELSTFLLILNEVNE